jgi:branched-chain amino acid transport system ATP-binding protein
MPPEGAALSVQALVSGYGATRILHGVDLALAPGEALAVLGRNGVGKTTLINTVAGRVAAQGGTVRIGGADITHAPAHARARAGIGLVPQDRQIFRTLSVEENLAVADLARGWSIVDSYALFPRLRQRRANAGSQLSGGEQQMLAIARALMGRPTCLLLDEPFEGLAPVIVDTLVDALQALRRDLHLTLVLVEQHARLALEIAGAALVLERGAVVLSGTRDALEARWDEVEALLSFAG